MMGTQETSQGDWRDTALKRLCRRVAAACYGVDVRISRLIMQWRHGRGEYELRGACVRCGACCQTPGIVLLPLMYHIKTIRRAVLWWQKVINGFELLSEDRPTHTFVFRCRHYDGAARRCRIYATRPGMCRDYPKGFVLTTNPEFLEGCGYYAHYRNADAMRRALIEQGISESTLHELEERLHLRD